MGEIRIGTSGWHYNHWKGNFYPEKLPASKMLAHYLQTFNTVELNGTYYRLPTPEAVREWYAATPKSFRFAFKASRFLTHNKKLKDPKDPLRRVLRAADGLKEKLGPILFQLPPHWGMNLDRLQAFLKILPSGYDFVFEFREPSWFCAPVYEALEKAQAAFCIYSMAGVPSPRIITSKLVYIRFHGASGKYHGDYPSEELAAWAKDIRSWSRGCRVHVYFNNDPEGHAPKNASELRTLLSV